MKARKIQEERFKDEKNVHCNAQMNTRLLNRHVVLGTEAKEQLREAMARLDMSARAYDRILKVARTIADLDSSEEVTAAHMREAVSYRNLDRGNWGSSI